REHENEGRAGEPERMTHASSDDRAGTRPPPGTGERGAKPGLMRPESRPTHGSPGGPGRSTVCPPCGPFRATSAEIGAVARQWLPGRRLAPTRRLARAHLDAAVERVGGLEAQSPH